MQRPNLRLYLALLLSLIFSSAVRLRRVLLSLPHIAGGLSPVIPSHAAPKSL